MLELPLARLVAVCPLLEGAATYFDKISWTNWWYSGCFLLDFMLSKVLSRKSRKA